MKGQFQKALNDLDFVENHNLYKINSDQVDPYINITLQETKKLFPDVSYIYFRKFVQEARPPLAQAYIFDFSTDIKLPENFGETVKNIWLTGKIPLIYAFTQTEVNIINGYEQPQYKDDSYRFSTIKSIEFANLAQNKIFSAKKLDNGSFWDEKDYQKYFNFKNSPYEILLRKLKDMLDEMVKNDRSLTQDKAKPLYQKLLLRSILVKYLEERTDEEDNRIFQNGFFQKYSGSDDSFISVLKKNGAIIDLFKQLEEDFNGNIFALSQTEIDVLKNKDLSLFIEAFDGYSDDKKQIYIWKLYSFNYLPIELISSIYEEFMPKVAGVVYTPPFLVDFLIDQSMPLEDLINKNTNFRVIDPACGSGVFLVAAFKRLVQAWKLKNQDYNPSIKVLQEILLNSIYGIDIQRESIELAAFSLTIALCDQLSPKKIRDLKFDDLTENNLFEKDFFTVILNEQNRYNELLKSFDLVIGNPPFIAKHTSNSLEIEKKRIEHKLPETPKSHRISQLFLEQSVLLAKPEGNICLLMPSETLLYRNYYKYRDYFFTNYYVKEIFDFTPLRRVLFPSATVATACFILNNSKTTNGSINHIVVKRTKPSKEKLYFEIDSYDCFSFSLNSLLTNNFVFKCNLMGGNRINRVVSDYRKNYSKLSTFLCKGSTEYPKLLIKQNIGSFKMKNQIIKDSEQVIEKDLKSETATFYARQPELLREISADLNKNYEFYKFQILCTSQRAALSKSYSTILVKDIENLPYIKDVELSSYEKIIIYDTLNNQLDLLRFGEKSKILKEITYKDKLHLSDFAQTFIRVLNSVYKNFHSEEPIITTSFICFPFYFGETPEDDLDELAADEEKLESHLQELIRYHHTPTLRINRVIRIYDKNIIYLIKPKQLRYWLRSIAIRDADETVADFIHQGF